MAKGKKVVRRVARVGQVFQGTDWRMDGRKLTVVSVKKQHKNEGRFKAGHYYATCKTKSGLVVKVDEARLFSSAYRLIPDVVGPITSDICESVENCGCAPTSSPAPVEVPETSSDEIISPA